MLITAAEIVVQGVHGTFRESSYSPWGDKISCADTKLDYMCVQLSQSQCTQSTIEHANQTFARNIYLDRAGAGQRSLILTCARLGNVFTLI